MLVRDMHVQRGRVGWLSFKGPHYQDFRDISMLISRIDQDITGILFYVSASYDQLKFKTTEWYLIDCHKVI